MRDLCDFGADVMEVMKKNHLSLEALANLYDDPGFRRKLVNFAAVADLQAQVLVARYRQLAVNRLIQQANPGNTEVEDETARKSAVELLRAKSHGNPKERDRQAPAVESTINVDLIQPLLAAFEAEPGAVDLPTPWALLSEENGPPATRARAAARALSAGDSDKSLTAQNGEHDIAPAEASR